MKLHVPGDVPIEHSSPGAALREMTQRPSDARLNVALREWMDRVDGFRRDNGEDHYRGTPAPLRESHPTHRRPTLDASLSSGASPGFPDTAIRGDDRLGRSP